MALVNDMVRTRYAYVFNSEKTPNEMVSELQWFKVMLSIHTFLLKKVNYITQIQQEKTEIQKLNYLLKF